MTKQGGRTFLSDLINNSQE